ncbi:MAG: transcription antitermination factor NusB [Parvularculaceae bacterium]
MTAPNPRRANARLAAVQALYQLEQTGAGVDTVVLEFKAHRLGGDLDGEMILDADDAHFETVTRGVVAGQAALDRAIEGKLAAGWSLKRLAATARAILRGGVYELVHCPDVPATVVVDEYVELARAFFDASEIGFVNAVLDAAARDARGADALSARAVGD